MRQVWTLGRIAFPSLTSEFIDLWLDVLDRGAVASANILAHCFAEQWPVHTLPLGIGNAVLLSIGAIQLGRVYYTICLYHLPLPPALDILPALDGVIDLLNRSDTCLHGLLIGLQAQVRHFRARLEAQQNPGPAAELSDWPADMGEDMRGFLDWDALMGGL